MSTETQHSFSSVLSVNPYKDTYFNGLSSFLSKTSAPEFSKDQFTISYLNTKEFITALIEVSKNIPDEDLYDAINSKAYDELALDQAVEYQIQFIESFSNLDDDNRFFHVFIVDPLDIAQTLASSIEKIKYLDIVIPTPLLLKSLYSKEIIDSNGVHCFIYIQENDAFITIYSDKEFLYTKSIKYSLIDMHERFCEIHGERIDYLDFFEFFTKQNLKDTQSEYKEDFIRLYKELFANINDILTYAKRAFEIEKFEQVYIGTQVQTVTKLDEMLEVELHIKSHDFNFDYGLESTDSYIDQLHSLMQIYTTVAEEDRYQSNFTNFHRPPAFMKRESGKLLVLTAASFALAFAYPVTYWVLDYAQQLQEELLKQEYTEIHNIKITRESTINNKRAEKEKALALLNTEKQEYIDKKNTLIKIHDVKVNYPMKAKLLSTVIKDLNKFGVKLKSLSYSETATSKTFDLNLVSSKDRKITKLVEYLTEKYTEKFKYNIEEISYDQDSRVYVSLLKMEIL